MLGIRRCILAQPEESLNFHSEGYLNCLPERLFARDLLSSAAFEAQANSRSLAPPLPPDCDDNIHRGDCGMTILKGNVIAQSARRPSSTINPPRCNSQTRRTYNPDSLSPGNQCSVLNSTNFRSLPAPRPWFPWSRPSWRICSRLSLRTSALPATNRKLSCWSPSGVADAWAGT